MRILRFFHFRLSAALCCLMLALMPLALHAETRLERAQKRSELRIGWGDQLFETLIWHNPPSVVTTMPADFSAVYHEDYSYLQHAFAEYSYRFNSWLGLGLLLDGSAVLWSDVTRNGLGEEVSRDPGHSFYNVVLMPTARATYLHHPNVNLYSSFGFGVLVNGGTEVDGYGRHTVAAPAFDFRLIGLSANWKQLFFTVDYGGMYSLLNANTIFLVKSRMFTASVGVRF